MDRGPVDVGVRHLVRARHQGLEGRLQRRQACDGQGALRSAVVGDGAGDDLVLGRLAGQLEVLLGELPGGLHRLAAAGGEEDLVEVAGRLVREPLRELDGLGVGVGPDREERQLLRLLGGRLGELLAAVTGLHHEQARQAVEVAPALVVPDVGALTADDGGDGRVLVRRHAGEVHPQVVVRGLAEVLGGVGAHGYRVPHM